MAAKRPFPLPTSRRKAVQGALLLAMTVLQDERVREQLRKAPVAAREWAEHRRAIDVGAPGAERRGPSTLDRLDPTQRFGQKGIERRLAALERNADLVFPDPTDRGGAVIFQAIDLLEAGSVYDLACIDWNMPVMDGLEFVVAARARADWRAMTLMMVTTEAEHGQIVRALAAGAHEYIIKPFTPDAIRNKLELLGLIPAEETV